MSDAQPQGFLASPPSTTNKGVLVMHAWWGLNDTLKAYCTKLSQAGYTAFAPDLYHGQVTDTIVGAEALSSALFGRLEQARQDAAAAARYLYQLCGEPAQGLAEIGFSLGAFMALDLSINQPQLIHKVVTYYGAHPGAFGTSQAAYLAHIAETDEYEPQEGMDEMQAALEKAGRPAAFYQYQGTGHWFAEADRSAYDAQAANLAWERTLAFLNETP